MLFIRYIPAWRHIKALRIAFLAIWSEVAANTNWTRAFDIGDRVHRLMGAVLIDTNVSSVWLIGGSLALRAWPMIRIGIQAYIAALKG